MKKFIIGVTILFSFGIFGQSFAVDLTTISKQIVIYQTELNKTNKGKQYLKIADLAIEKYKNNETFLFNLQEKFDKITISEIKDKNIINMLNYLNAKVNFTLLKLQNSDLTNIQPTKITTTEKGKSTELKIKVIKDDRDSSISVNGIVDELKSLPSTQNAEFTIVDFGDEGVKDYMTENGIKFLPAFIFSTNNFDVSKDRGGLEYKINYYLTALPSGEYTLAIGAVYDSFVERSDRGFRLLTQEQYDLIKAQGSYIEGNKNAKITWLEYSDLQCPYSTLLYTTGTLEAVKAKYGEDINIRFNHFPLNFHPNAEPAAEIAECLGTQKGVTAFYSLVETAFANNTIMNGSDSSAARKLLIDEAVKLGANETTLTACVDAKTYSQKIADQMNSGSDIFGITGTPGNVFINNETLEYEILSGAYPISYFEDIIDKLLK